MHDLSTAPPRAVTSRSLHVALLALASLLTVTLPWLALRLTAWRVAADLEPSYLPSLEPARARAPFRAEPIDQLRYLRPGWVFIGDSILGTRLDDLRFSELNGYDTVGILFHAGTGPAWWYLAFKNWLVASGEKPVLTFVFFRDEQLTDTMFRLTDQYRGSLDEVALEREPVLDGLVAARLQGRWSLARRRVVRAFEADRVRDWLEPGLRWLPAVPLVAPERRAALGGEVNQLFALDRLRPFATADTGGASREPADFHELLPSSVLPAMTRLARANGLRLCFVRARRRPGPNGEAPPQPPWMAAYVADLRAWLEGQGMLLIDDTFDDRLSLDMYEDGDHVRDSARRRYTELLAGKVRAALAQP